MRILEIKLAFVLPFLAPLSVQAAEPFKFVDGDRVVFLGSTLIEREQRYGYWETAITIMNPDKKITFRNLGWSGDTVWGEARAGFGTQADGFALLKKQVFECKPTVIFVGYGTNESFAGEKGLSRFQDGLDKLLDTLIVTKARIVLISPVAREPYAHPQQGTEVLIHRPGFTQLSNESAANLIVDEFTKAEHFNEILAKYCEILKKTAEKRHFHYCDLFFGVRYRFHDICGYVPAITENGIHPGGKGYLYTSALLEERYLQHGRLPKIAIGYDGRMSEDSEAKFENVQTQPLRFEASDLHLPMCGGSSRFLWFLGVPGGIYQLKIDGKPLLKIESKNERITAATLTSGPELDQTEKLRQLIIEKNRLYFHRYRPENETYLFGFRKYEQGQNAKEVPQFDPLIEKLEAAIDKLKKPVKHRYELIRVEK